MTKLALRAAIGLLLTLVAVYLGDWAVWRARAAAGRRMGKTSVSHFQVAPLKGDKEEYYYTGTADVECSRSLFAQAGSSACWWLERHKVVFER